MQAIGGFCVNLNNMKTRRSILLAGETKNGKNFVYKLFLHQKSFYVRAGLSKIPITYCNKFAGSISRWKFITLTVQYTTLDYSSQLF